MAARLSDAWRSWDEHDFLDTGITASRKPLSDQHRDLPRADMKNQKQLFIDSLCHALPVRRKKSFTLQTEFPAFVLEKGETAFYQKHEKDKKAFGKSIRKPDGFGFVLSVLKVESEGKKKFKIYRLVCLF